MTMSGFLGKITEDMDENNGSIDISPLEQLQCIREAQARNDNKVRLNVGGIRHETYKTTLSNIPDTRLAWLTQPSSVNNADYDPINQEFYFDRHPRIFDAILNYYRTGKLHAPSDVCGPAFEEELVFWGIDEKQIEPCCWASYTQHRDAQETLIKLTGPEFESDDENEETDVASYFNITEEIQDIPSRWQVLRPKVWIFLEYPYSSKGAAVFAIVSMFAVILSIVTFCLETLYYDETTGLADLSLFILEGVCVIWFMIELTTRFIFCPDKKQFFYNMFHVIDFVACIPFYVDCVVRFAKLGTSNGLGEFVGFLRIVRIFRVFKLTRHFSGLQILLHTIRSSAKELMLLSMFLGIGVLTFGSLLYYAEKLKDGSTSTSGCERIENIPTGFWWAVVTMTTVGYGDVCPLTPLGKFIGSVTGVFGVLMIALPVPVIVNNFALYYSHAQARLKLPKKRKRVLGGAAGILNATTVIQNNASSSISGYSTQSTNDNDCDNTSMHIDNEETTVKTALIGKSVSGSLPVFGEKTDISVQFVDEIPSSRCTVGSPDIMPVAVNKKPGTGKRASILPSFKMNGGQRAHGRNSVKSRRPSFLPANLMSNDNC